MNEHGEMPPLRPVLGVHSEPRPIRGGHEVVPGVRSEDVPAYGWSAGPAKVVTRVLDIVIPLLIIVACWCLGAVFVVPFYLTLLALAIAVIWRGYYSYVEARDAVELDCGFGDTVFGRPALTVIEGERKPVWPNEAGAVE